MFEVRAKKHLGQHFLKDANIARKIVDSLPDTLSNVLEVGPGTGVLSKYLLARDTDQFKLIEVDQEAVDFLKKEYGFTDVQLVHSDFLKYPLENLFSSNYWLIGNFPYNISSQIFFKVLEHRNQIDGVVGMVQKEVAQRLISPPGNKEYGILSVLLQAFYRLEYLFTVSESVFVPPPRVKSAVIRLVRNEVKDLGCDEVLFRQVVKSSFNTRRKTLRNGLKSLGFASELFADPIFDKRPEQLGVEEFVRICSLLQQRS
jgi:16S rRNA (adenine1518-N6/adenine1519-N6)-dimethyltransferase